MADVTVRDEGSLFLFTPHTDTAEAWIENHVSPEATWFGPSLVVEHRYARNLALAMLDAGLEVR